MMNQQTYLYKGNIEYMDSQQLKDCQITILQDSLRIICKNAVIFYSTFKEHSLGAEWIIVNHALLQLNLFKEHRKYRFTSPQLLPVIKHHLDGRIRYLNFDNSYDSVEIITNSNHQEIKLVRNRATNEIHLAKHLKNIGQEEEINMSLIQPELLISQVLQAKKHKNVIHFLSYYAENESFIFVYDARQYFSLYKHLKQHPQGLPLKETKKIMKQLLKGLAHIHSQGVVLRDVRLDALLLTGTPRKVLKIMDLAFAALENHLPSIAKVGTPGYIAPEVFSNNLISSYSDIFSAGAILHLLLTGQSVFKDESWIEVMHKNHLNQKKILYDKITCPDALDLLQKMLSDLGQRPTAKECLTHNFFKSLKQEHQQDKIQQLPQLKAHIPHFNGIQDKSKSL